ncbi:MAG: hypothetical protein ACE5IK_07050 [Acidobacteriota bacterium]
MRQDSLIEHIWARHEFNVLARSATIHGRVSAMVESDPPRVAEAMELMAEALANRPTRSGWGLAIDRAWKKIAGKAATCGFSRSGFLAARKKGPDEARRFLFRAATACRCDELIGSSLLDDTPMPGFAFYAKGKDWWQVREKNGHLSSLPLNGLLSRAASSARRDAVLAGEGILRHVGGAVYPDPRFVPVLRSKGVWSDAWSTPATRTA